jgi:hypothetical protein
LYLYYIPIKIYLLVLINKPTERFLNLKKIVKIKSEKFFEMGRFRHKPAPKEPSFFKNNLNRNWREVVLEKKEPHSPGGALHQHAITR